MLPLLNWMLLGTLVLGACWFFYQLVLRKEACFHFNRRFLQVAPWLAILLPLLPLHSLSLGSWLPSSAPNAAVVTPVEVLSAAPALPIVAPQAPAAEPTLWPWLSVLYAAGVVWWLGRLGWQLTVLHRTTRCLLREEEFAYTLVLTNGKLSISSFGKYIFWDETANLSPTEAQQVLHHELAHVQQGHTWEQLHLEVLRAVLWFNPFVHLLPRALRLTHEYLADAAVVATTPTAEASTNYSTLLARLTLRQLYADLPLVHSFASSQTLTRIAMLHSRSARSWKRWLVLPLSTGLLVTLACAQGPEPPASLVNTQTIDDTVYAYQQVEQVPIYETGTSKLFHDLTAQAKPAQYSRATIYSKFKGRLTIKFTVTENGSMQGVAIDQSSSTLAGAAAAVKEAQEKILAAVRNLPGHWTPGRQANLAVPVVVTIVCDVNPEHFEKLLSKYSYKYGLATDWSFDGVNAQSSQFICVPDPQQKQQVNKAEVNQYAIRPDPSYYKTHKRQ